MRRNQRSKAAEKYRNLYWTPAWRAMSKHQLAVEPLCCMCQDEGRIVPATVADHVDRHYGDSNLFFTSKLQSLCKRCHDSKKQSIERRGYDSNIGADGWPTDSKHPFLTKS
jgi:hypothetical protein